MSLVNETVLEVASTLGWVGAIGTVGAYALVSRRRLDAASMRFQAANAAGALLLAVSALTRGNWPSAASNLLWMFFGVQALFSAREVCRAGLARHWRSLRQGLGRARQSVSSTTQQWSGLGRSRAV